MPSAFEWQEMILDAWRTNTRVTVYLIEHLPSGLWTESVPGAPRRTVRLIAGHIHNARCMWLKILGKESRTAVPRNVDRYSVERQELAAALNRSSRGILDLLALGCEHGGKIPVTRSYVWRNLPLDVGHVLSYSVAHEGHHRGQIVMLARQLGYRLPAEVTSGLWLWTKGSVESRG